MNKVNTLKNIWIKGSVLTNPYHETAFQLLGITRDITSRKIIAQKMEDRKQAIRTMNGFYRVGNRPLTEADVTHAGSILFDPVARAFESVLEHKPESLHLDALKRFGENLKMPIFPEKRPSICHLKGLAHTMRELALDYIDKLDPVEIPPFPLVLRPVPPFGSIEKVDND